MKTRGCLREFGLLVVLFFCYGMAACYHRSQFAPAADVHTFDDLRRQGVPMTRSVLLPSLQGHVCVYGDVKPLLWTLPSGPPAYHFDAQGRLIDFTLDIGDSTKFQQEYDTGHGKEIALADLQARFNEAAR